jgi:hypothetical protein
MLVDCIVAYIEELRVVRLAVNGGFTHFRFCVGHEAEAEDGGEIDYRREEKQKKKKKKEKKREISV